MKKFLIAMILLIGAAIYLAHLNLQKSFRSDWDLKEHRVAPPSRRPAQIDVGLKEGYPVHPDRFNPPEPD